jgi:hypothetical protein
MAVYYHRGNTNVQPDQNSFDWQLEAVRWTAGGWGSPEPLATGSWPTALNGTPLVGASNVGVARARYDHQSNLLVIWQHEKSFGGADACRWSLPDSIRAARYSQAAKAWVATADVAGGTPTSILGMFLDAGDDVTTFWNDHDGCFNGTPPRVALNVLGAASGVWKGTENIAGYASSAPDAAAAMDGEDNAFVISVPGNGAPGLLAQHREGASGSWSSGEQLDPTEFR